MFEAIRKVKIILRTQHVQEIVGSFDDASQNNSTGKFRNRKDMLVNNVYRILLASFLDLHSFNL